MLRRVAGAAARARPSIFGRLTPLLWQALLLALGPRYLPLLAPHRTLRAKFVCGFAGCGAAFGAVCFLLFHCPHAFISSAAALVRTCVQVGFLLSDCLLLCKRKRRERLKPKLLCPLRTLRAGEHPVSGALGGACAGP